jgi:HK97 gp10 family phage protein
MARGSTSRGLRLELSQKNVAGVIARIYSSDRACQNAVREATQDAGEFCRELTALYAPKDTGRMARLVRTTYDPEGFSFETGWSAVDFADEGEPFYPPFQEFGTRFMPAQPSLYPAYKETQPYYIEQIRAAIREAVSRQRAGFGATT